MTAFDNFLTITIIGWLFLMVGAKISNKNTGALLKDMVDFVKDSFGGGEEIE